MSDSEQDEVEAYLKRRVPLHKGKTPADRLEPPAELDRIVIGQARQAIQAPAPIPVYRAPSWALPTALATSILISFAIMLGLGVRAAKHADAPARARTADALPAVSSASATSSQATSGAVLELPRIATPPWPPISRTARTPHGPARQTDGPATPSTASSTDAARTRDAHAEVAAKRSRPDVGRNSR